MQNCMSGNLNLDNWGHIKPQLSQFFGEKAYESWLKFLKFDQLAGGRVYLTVPSRFLRDWITTRFGDKLLTLWKKENNNIHSIEISVQAGEDSFDKTLHTNNSPNNGSSLDTVLTAPNTKLDTTTANTNSLLNAPPALDPRYTFETFVVGKPNELAYAAAQRVATANVINFNPLFLHGGVGLGKTHLMHAIAWHIQNHQKHRQVIYMSAEQFMYQFVRALRHKNMISFREQFRSVDVLMIDDVQFISGKDSTQEEFFHTFNALMDKKKQIILSADKSPSELDGLQERVRSRMGWGLVADIHPTTYELRLGILSAKVEVLDIEIPPLVLEFLAHKITSNIRELEGALNRIVAHATLVGQKITLDSTQQALKDLLRANERSLTIEDIQKTVAEHYNVRIADMHSNRRLRVVARPRQVAMFLCKQLTPKSLPEIGRKFGGRDHTTVMHAVKKVGELMATDPLFEQDITMLENMLKK